MTNQSHSLITDAKQSFAEDVNDQTKIFLDNVDKQNLEKHYILSTEVQENHRLTLTDTNKDYNESAKVKTQYLNSVTPNNYLKTESSALHASNSFYTAHITLKNMQDK